jgi:hypothetical protein
MHHQEILKQFLYFFKDENAFLGLIQKLPKKELYFHRKKIPFRKDQF